MKNILTNYPKFLCVAALIIASLSLSTANAQEEKSSFKVSLNSDQFFGFYPFFQGSYTLNPKVDFTFYGILWSGGTGGAWGNWTEFGMGLNFNVAEGLNINPQIGILGGNLLSSATANQGVLGDGIVPNITIGLNKTKVEGEIYAGFYAPLRDKTLSNGTTLSYLHYWTNLGYKVSEKVSFGAHYEHLVNTGGSQVENSTDVYQWFGPYLQFAIPDGGPFARFSFGKDLVKGNDSFFKLTTGFNF
jgi:hypothetical protein